MSQLKEIDENIWTMDGPTVRWFTMPFPTRMTIIRLEDGGLFIHSPIKLTDDVRREVEALGEPKYLISPNKYHHLFLGQWKEAYPEARMYAPPGLGKKRIDLTFDGALGDGVYSPWKEEISQCIFRGSWAIDEVIFFHKTSRTVIFGDLIENFDPESLDWFHRFLARMDGLLAPDGSTPRDMRQSFRGRHREARRSFRKIRRWDPEVIVMSHGLPIYEKAGTFLESAFSWIEKGEQ